MFIGFFDAGAAGAQDGPLRRTCFEFPGHAGGTSLMRIALFRRKRRLGLSLLPWHFSQSPLEGEAARMASKLQSSPIAMASFPIPQIRYGGNEAQHRSWFTIKNPLRDKGRSLSKVDGNHMEGSSLIKIQIGFRYPMEASRAARSAFLRGVAQIQLYHSRRNRQWKI